MNNIEKIGHKYKKLAEQDSNLRMLESESRALPLDDRQTNKKNNILNI